MIRDLISNKSELRYQGKSPGKFLEVGLTSEQEMIFDLARQLVHAQFCLADDELTNRLWREVADRKIDEKRIINLMYKCSFHEDNQSMCEADELFITFRGGIPRRKYSSGNSLIKSSGA
ncbi:hypothetical protein [Prochlorococcus sp. MIT 1300]|uniref:hypothetical protein n=1 Tax=Prochlorococcus sp. MIT 1300 TaxID=3096218 RepID=UPI002A75929F|nr:hypothetical protein [Prochlorococcus sp. MIT 1300]